MDKKNITFYGASWCAYCVQLRHALDKDDIAYDYKNVDEDANEAAMLEASGGRYLIPTLVIGDEAYQNPPAHMIKELVA